MKMTSMDIMNRQFKKGIRGYDINEVDEFIEKVAEDYETIFKENSAFREKVISFEEKIEHYGKIENTIQNTLLLAQNTAEQAKEAAQREAEFIVKNANEVAARMLEKANNDVIRISDEHDRLKQEFLKFRNRYKNFLNSQMDMFTSMETDFLKDYNVGALVEENIKVKDLEDDRFRISNVDLAQTNFKDDLNEVKSFFIEE